MVDLALLSTLGASGLAELAGTLPLTRNKPNELSLTKKSMAELAKGLDSYLTKLQRPLDYQVKPFVSVPTADTALGRYMEVRKDSSPYASSGLPNDGSTTYTADDGYGLKEYRRYVDDGKGGQVRVEPVNINPMADRAYFAHELGHTVARQQGLGALLSQARQSPRVRNAMYAASILSPITLSAALQDNEDLAASIGLSAAAVSPIILDEINATRHGLGIMKEAGLPATAGQRARLAGALLSYLALPAVAGVVGNRAGNFIEDQLAG